MNYNYIDDQVNSETIRIQLYGNQIYEHVAPKIATMIQLNCKEGSMLMEISGNVKNVLEQMTQCKMGGL